MQFVGNLIFQAFVIVALVMFVFKVRMLKDCRISPKENHISDQMDKALSATTLFYVIFVGTKVLVSKNYHSFLDPHYEDLFLSLEQVSVFCALGCKYRIFQYQ